MHAIRQKCRPKHQVLILKCYPRTVKGAVDVKPNSSELSYLLYYVTTRRSKVQKVGEFLEKKTAGDIWRARIGNVQVTLQILAALIEKAPRDLPLYAPYVLKILKIILRAHDITMVEASLMTFEAFCQHHDGASLSADQEYLHKYQEIVEIYASLASTGAVVTKPATSAPVVMRWRVVGLLAVKSAVSSEALGLVTGRQLEILVLIILENTCTDDEEFIYLLEQRVEVEGKNDKEKLVRRKTSVATVRTVESTVNTDAAALSGTTADADKHAEENIGVLAVQCLKQVFMTDNRSQIHEATLAILKFVTDRVEKQENFIKAGSARSHSAGWATRILQMAGLWTPVQDRYIILVTAMEKLVRSPLAEENIPQQLVLAMMIDSLLRSDINLIGLSVMDVLLSLIQHFLRVLHLSGPSLHEGTNSAKTQSPSDSSTEPLTESSPVLATLRMNLLGKLQDCIASLATHVYYADQISDMVGALLLRLKPSPNIGTLNIPVTIDNLNPVTDAKNSGADLTEDTPADGFFSFDTAKVRALDAIKSIFLVAAIRKGKNGGGFGRNRVSIRVWEGTQWLLRDNDGRVRKAYVAALLTWMDHEMTKTDLRVFEDKPKMTLRTTKDESAASLTKRAVSNASQKEKPSVKSPARTTFLELLHLSIYENALNFVESETDFILLHILLASLVENLGVNAVKHGLPMIFRLQEDILDAETPLAKIRIGSLCHGYFWTLSEKFDFEASPVGAAIKNEVSRRQSKLFWINQIRQPPISLEQIGTPGHMSQQILPLPIEKLESEALRPFDDRSQMVKLISLSYTESLETQTISPPTSPIRSFNQPILGFSSFSKQDALPEKVKQEMMSEWSRETVMTVVQQRSKTVSLNGSRSITNATGQRNFLAVNGNMNGGGSHNGRQSPQRHCSQYGHRGSGRPGSNYCLIGGPGGLQKLRRGGGQSPSALSESSRNSITRIEQLKRVLSGHEGNLPSENRTRSDASSESMVSYTYTASELSLNAGQQDISQLECSLPTRELRDASRPKYCAAAAEHSRPSSSNPASVNSHSCITHDTSEVTGAAPPVPPLPPSRSGQPISTGDNAFAEFRIYPTVRQASNPKNSVQGYQSWVNESDGPTNLDNLLNGIRIGDEGVHETVAKPPY